MKRELRNVLVVYKKSSYELYVKEHKNKNFREMFEKGGATVDKMFREHEENNVSLQRVRDVLKQRKIRSRWVYRARLEEFDGFDLVLSVGGDGTLLEAATKIFDDTPVLGLISSLTSSVGYLCAGKAVDVDQYLEWFSAGLLPRYRLSRIAISINGMPIRPYALNDILISHESPAATSRYKIRIGEQAEEHRSSGVWVSTATGSTAGLHAAGGKIMPLQSRRLQYFVRELYSPPSHPSFLLNSGFFKPSESIEVVSKMRRAAVYIDGPRRSNRIQFDDLVTMNRAPSSVVLLGDIESRRSLHSEIENPHETHVENS